MAESIRVTALPTPHPVGVPASWLRMAVVIMGSIATLVALPGWLRSLEEGPAFPHLSQPAAPTSSGDSAAPVDARAASQSREAPHHQALAEFLSKRYRVSSEAVERFIRLAYSAAQMTKLDPLLILAVMAVESSFNPIAESGMGAKGLMQVIPEFHQDKLKTPQGAALNVLDPETNIMVGAKVLREYAAKTGGDYVAALGLYGGTGAVQGNPYASKVLTERERLEEFLRRSPQRPVSRPLPVPERT